MKKKKRYSWQILSAAFLFVSIFNAAESLADPPLPDYVDISPILQNATVDQDVIDYGDWYRKMATSELTTSGTVEIEASGPVVELRAPIVKLKDGFHAEAGSNLVVGTRKFWVKCINMTDPRTAEKGKFFASPISQEDFDTFCKNEIDIINHHFVNELGQQLIRFKFKEAVLWDSNFVNEDVYKCQNDLFDPNTDEWCDNLPPQYVDEKDVHQQFDEHDANAINLYIYQPPNPKGWIAGRTYTGSPYILMLSSFLDENYFDDCNGNGLFDDDPNRLNPTSCKKPDPSHFARAGEVHELGHVFGLAHVRDKDAKAPDNNIMQNIGGMGYCCMDSKNPNKKLYQPGMWGNLGFYFETNGYFTGREWETEVFTGRCQYYKRGYVDDRYILYRDTTSEYLSSSPYYRDGADPSDIPFENWKKYYRYSGIDYGQAEIVMSFAEDYALRMDEAD